MSLSLELHKMVRSKPFQGNLQKLLIPTLSPPKFRKGKSF